MVQGTALSIFRNIYIYIYIYRWLSTRLQWLHCVSSLALSHRYNVLAWLTICSKKRRCYKTDIKMTREYAWQFTNNHYILTFRGVVSKSQFIFLGSRSLTYRFKIFPKLHMSLNIGEVSSIRSLALTSWIAWWAHPIMGLINETGVKWSWIDNSNVNCIELSKMKITVSKTYTVMSLLEAPSLIEAPPKWVCTLSRNSSAPTK